MFEAEVASHLKTYPPTLASSQNKELFIKILKFISKVGAKLALQRIDLFILINF